MMMSLALVLSATPLKSWAFAVISGAQQPAEGSARGAVALVRGVVRDADGAVIAGAMIFLRNAADGTMKSARCGNDGSFEVASVTVGTYTITVTRDGFSPLVLQHERVSASMPPLDLNLRIETQAISVTVTADEVSVDPASGGGSLTLGERGLDALADDPDEFANQLNAMAGARAGSNGEQIYVDGFTGGRVPPKSAIREIRINQNPYSAQYDRPGQGRVEILTKPGTDRLHGNLSFQYMEKAFNTVTPFLQGANQPGYHHLLLLGSLTGPIRPNVSYSFAGSRRTLQDNSIFSGTVASMGPNNATLCAPGVGATTCGAYSLPADQRATFTPGAQYDLRPRVDFAIGSRNTTTLQYEFAKDEAKSAGIGGLLLASLGNDTETREHRLQLSNTQTFSARAVNDTRFAFGRSRFSQTPLSAGPTFNVIGSFVAGGSPAGAQSSTNDHLEVQDYASLQRDHHLYRAGTRLRSDRQALYSSLNANSSFSYRTVMDYLNNEPFLYTRTRYSNSRVSGRVTDLGMYAEDEWKARPNLMVGYGLRYEAQSVISSQRDLAPRFSFNYALPHRGKDFTTTLRVGYGIFLERFGIAPVMTTILQNGINSSQFVARASGAGVLSGCSPAAVALCNVGTTSSATTYSHPASLRSAYQSHLAFTVDQELPRHTVLSATVLYRRGIHQYFSRSLPASGSNLQYEFQSGGYSRHTQVILNARSQVTARFSVSGFAQFNAIQGNSNGVNSFQTDSLHPKVDDGWPVYWNRAWTYASGEWQAPLGLAISPFLFASTGDVYSITTGVDTNGDSIVNDRPAFANGAQRNASCLNPSNFVAPPQGTVDYARVPAGSCTGPAGVTFNTRIVRAFAVGPGSRRAGGGQAANGAVNPRYTLSVGAQILNLFNNVNYATQNGNLSAVSSGLFGKSQTLQGGTFSSGSAVRRIFLQVNLAF